MKLTETVCQIIGDKNSKEAKAIRSTLALALSFTDLWVARCIEANKDNGPLTTMKAIQVIKRSTGLSEKQILEEEPVRA